jgi:ubiquinone biosynthesis protein COQ4
LIETLALPHYDLPRAGSALAALMRDPDDLPQVFALIDSLSGTAPHRLLFRFRRSKTGARILRERRDIVPVLDDREALRALPEGTLGRAYLAFVESEGISPKGIRDASGEGTTLSGRRRPESFVYLHARMRDTHDLWHAATGYKGDVVGELSLLAFTLAQNWNTAVAVIVLTAILKGFGGEKIATIGDGFRRGWAAAWLPAQDWESLLALPLVEVRERLALGSAPEYTPVRTSELRAQGRL